MSMRIYRPFNEIRRIEDEINNVFQNVFDRPTDMTGVYRLNVDLLENPDKYIIKTVLPGFTTEDINIEATRQYVDIRASKSDEEAEEGFEWLIQELQNLHLRRRISFDKPVDPNKGETTLKNGVLTITMPKMEGSKSVKLIPEELD